MGYRDKRELAIVGPAPDGQTELSGGAAQRDEALLDLQTRQTWRTTSHMTVAAERVYVPLKRYLRAPVQLLHRRFRHGGRAADRKKQTVTDKLTETLVYQLLTCTASIFTDQ